VRVALQANGISVVEINNRSLVIRFFVGNIDIAMRYLPRFNRFTEVYRSFIDGRRGNEPKRIPDSRYKSMIRQAFAIAAEHEWKK
jgi:hypothetical protein